MQISKCNLGIKNNKINVVRSFFHTNPIIKSSNLKPLAADTLQINSETNKYISNLSSQFSKSNVDINGKTFTKFNHSQMGSNPAFWANDTSTGKLFYIKLAESSDKVPHLQEEVTACKLYRLAGINAPEVEMCNLPHNQKGLMSKYSEGLKSLTYDKELKECFAVDAWLANWDSLMPGNCMTKDGKPFKLDNGGALRFRAQGLPKPNFDTKVDELTTLVDGRNRASSYVYNSIDHESLVNSFKKVCSISDNDIKSVVNDKSLAKTLINRKNYMSEVLKKIEKTPKTEKNLYDYMVKILGK